MSLHLFDMGLRMLSLLAAVTLAAFGPLTCPVHLSFAYGDMSTIRTHARDGYDDVVLAVRVSNVGTLAQWHGTHQHLVVFVEGNKVGSEPFAGLAVGQSAVLKFPVPVQHVSGPLITIASSVRPLPGSSNVAPVARSRRMIHISMQYLLDEKPLLGDPCTTADDRGVFAFARDPIPSPLK